MMPFRSRPPQGGSPAPGGAPKPPAAKPGFPGAATGRPFPVKPDGRMMADGGGIGAPSPFGGGGKTPAVAPMPGAAPGADEPDADDMGGAYPSPESVHYHDDPQSCEACQYMGDDTQCQILHIQVSPQGQCSAFSPKQGGGEQGEMDMGGGGAPPPPAGGPPQQ